MRQVCWPWLSQEPLTLVPFLSDGCTSPNTNAHSKTTDVGVFIETYLDETTVACENIPKLVHGCTPAETLVNVIEDVISVGFFHGFKIFVYGISQTLGSRHQASPRIAARLMRLRMLVVTVGTVVCPG